MAHRHQKAWQINDKTGGDGAIKEAQAYLQSIQQMVTSPLVEPPFEIRIQFLAGPVRKKEKDPQDEPKMVVPRFTPTNAS